MNPGVSRLLRLFLVVVAVVFIARNVAITLKYGAGTLDWVGTMTQTPEWTNARVISQLKALRSHGPDETIVSTASSSTIVRMEAASLEGRPLLFFGRELSYDVNQPFNMPDTWAALLGQSAFRAALRNEIEEHRRAYDAQVVLHASSLDGRPYSDTFYLDPRVRLALLKPHHTLLLESFNGTLLNTWAKPGQYSDKVTLRPYDAVHNLLVYVNSEYVTKQDAYSEMLYRFESDVFDPAKKMAGIGRHLLFHVVNPDKRIRVEMVFSSTLSADGKNEIPPALVMGARSVRLPAVGHGAARFFSPPVAPVNVDRIPFVEIDMGRDGKAFPSRRRGIMKLFGNTYQLDYRRIVGFVRDISVVSDAQYRLLRAPQALSEFPKGLEDPNLEFSGLYEDGWMADQAVVWLSTPNKGTALLTLRATVPPEATQNSLRVSLALDGKTLGSVMPNPGELVLQVPAPGDGRRHEIRITATPYFHLPGGDNRPATMHIERLGFD